MNRPWRRYAAGVALVLTLAFALRLDLRQFAGQRAQALLDADRPQAAQTAYRLAVVLGLDPAVPAHALGVHHYRAGRHEQARQQFSAAIDLAGPARLPDLYYNRGNSHFRLAEASAEAERDAAATRYARAVADFERALALQPDAADARANLRLARARLAQAQVGEQTAGTPSGEVPARAQADARRPDTQRAEAGSAPAESADAAASDAGGGDDAPSGSDPTGGGTPRELTPDEAARLLRDARAREGVRGMPLAADRHATSQSPDKDW